MRGFQAGIGGAAGYVPIWVLVTRALTWKKYLQRYIFLYVYYPLQVVLREEGGKGEVRTGILNFIPMTSERDPLLSAQTVHTAQMSLSRSAHQGAPVPAVTLTCLAACQGPCRAQVWTEVMRGSLGRG